MGKRQIHRLSAKFVKEVRKPGFYADGGNLYLQVSESLSKSWIFRYTVDGESHDMGLGSALDVTLAQARTKAADCRKLRLDGIDPLANKREQEAINAREKAEQANTLQTFENVANECIKSLGDGWTHKHHQQWVNTLKQYAYPVLGSMPIAEIQVDDIKRVLKPIWLSKTETASRVRGRIEAVLAYAITMEYRKEPNPAVWRNNLQYLLAKPGKLKTVIHYLALPYQDLVCFMAALREVEGEAARALEFLVLTVCRTNEVLGARCAEIDFVNKVWVVPSERMKAGETHVVPLLMNAWARYCVPPVRAMKRA